ncbi:hypothetical protein [Mesorhizobium sp. B2-7-1]|uniref:hypothetical protein n=1 Tax=Mesorhizobium sp. B2-7-1 TaxID=2589909 RepID=UPI00112D0EA9|nr:hypothetical protein [Mesorhizobium sp. B2-7-1]TPJ72688.1 hypothetical protein FJ471_06330 [Mesorhizobium sp. B2-7-1]
MVGPVGPHCITAFANDLKESREHDTGPRIAGYGIEDQSLGQDLIRRGLQYQRTRASTTVALADIARPYYDRSWNRSFRCSEWDEIREGQR